MSLRVAVPADGAWYNIGTSPATVQVLTDGASLMVACETSAPAGSPDGVVLTGGPSNPGSSHYFQLAATNIWAQAVSVAVVAAVQPE